MATGVDGWIRASRVHLYIRRVCPPKTALPSGRIRLTSRHKSDVLPQYIRPVEKRQHALDQRHRLVVDQIAHLQMQNGVDAVLDNPRHERFAQEVAQGTSQREAYKIAGYSVKNDASADASASRLLSDARVAARVQEIQNAVSVRTVEKTSITKAWVIAKLVENVERAMEAEAVVDPKGNPTGEYKYNGNVANRALELLGKEIGMFVDRKEVGGPGAFSDLNDEELQEAILEQTRELAELDPEFAKQLAQKRATKH